MAGQLPQASFGALEKCFVVFCSPRFTQPRVDWDGHRKEGNANNDSASGGVNMIIYKQNL